jgi:uncharacterized membrane protein YbhN (UPF0104 family)
MEFRKYIKISLSVLLVALFIGFFYKEFKANWESVRTFKLIITWPYFFLGLLTMILNYVCTTLSWHIGINGLDNRKKLTLAQSISLVNISQLGKYIPGKLWSYMVQIYWLSSKGFPKATILYLNVITTVLPILVSLVLGGLLLIMLPNWSHLKSEILFFVVCLLIVNVILLNQNFLKFFIDIFSRITRKKVSFCQISSCRIIFMQLIYVIGAFLWTLAGCLIALGIGFEMDSLRIIFVSSSMLLGDVIGFLVLIAPGGLGVREGTMYMILKGTGVIYFALIFPIVIRLLSIVTDLVVGIASLVIISKSKYSPMK